MKKFIFGFIATALFGLISCAQNTPEKIGIIENGKYKITSTLEKVKAEWSALLKNQKNETQLVSFEIKSGVDSKLNNETYYYLVGKNDKTTTKVAALLTLQNDVFYMPADEKLYGTTGTVTCTGCSYGCNPEKIFGKWYCSSECGTNCTKSVTVTTPKP